MSNPVRESARSISCVLGSKLQKGWVAQRLLAINANSNKGKYLAILFILSSGGF
jgi:hypothetical protein